jgi:hypothetical protein
MDATRSSIVNLIPRQAQANIGYLAVYRGTSPIINKPLLGTYGRTMSRAIWWPWGGKEVVMSEVPLSSSPGLQLNDPRVAALCPRFEAYMNRDT